MAKEQLIPPNVVPLERTPLGPDLLMTEAFMTDWPRVRQAILPIWQQVTGEADIYNEVEIKERHIIGSESFDDLITAGKADHRKGMAFVYWEREAIDEFYRGVFHELTHLWFHRKGKDFVREVTGLTFASRVRIHELFSDLPVDKQTEVSEFVEFFYPNVYQGDIDVGMIAKSVNESATEAWALRLGQRFAEYYHIKESPIVAEGIQTLFACDNPNRYIILIAALRHNKCDIQKTMRYFLATRGDKILKDLSPLLKIMTNEKELAIVAAGITKKMGVRADIEIAYETTEAAKKFPDLLVDFQKKRSQATRLPRVLSGKMLRNFLDRKPRSFLIQAQKVTAEQRICDFIVTKISRVYNQLLTTPRAQLDLPELRRDIVFALQLYEYLQTKSPTEAFRIARTVKALKNL